MKIETTLLNAAAEMLRQSDRPLLLAHPRPDGDTIGCALALRLALKQLGKEPLVACPHPLSATMTYLPGAEEFLTEVPVEADIDLVVVIDMSDLKRTGGLYHDSWRGRMPLLVIDHHETNDGFGDVSIITPDAAATSLPMFALIKTLAVTIDRDIATCLLLATLTDTRGLRTESTTPELLALVAELIEAGGDYLRIMQKTLDSVPYQQMRGWGVALERLQLQDNVAWTTFPLAEKEALGIQDHDDLDLGNLISRVAEANIIATFLEMHDGSVKISFRARPGYNVAQIAKSLNGGGHRLAAGCSVPGPLEEATERVLPLVHQEIRANSTG